MILRRLGNKAALADKIISYFPAHKVYYELFMGAGSIFFTKPQSKYSILNDLDQDVYNLFLVVKDNKTELIKLLSITPLSEDLFYYWKAHTETDPVKRALRFLYLSNLSYLGKQDTFRMLHSDVSHMIKLEKLIETTSIKIQRSLIRSKDFREFFKDIYFSDAHIGTKDRFIYADPPYLDTEENYATPKWTKKSVMDLFNTLEDTKIRFAMSEFDHPFILEEAENRGLNVTFLGERRNLKNKRTEILITNYTQSAQINIFNAIALTKNT